MRNILNYDLAPFAAIFGLFFVISALIAPPTEAQREKYRKAKDKMESNVGQDKDAVRNAATTMLEANESKAIEDLISTMERTASPTNPTYFWQIVLALSNVDSEEGVNKLKQEILNQRNQRIIRHPLFFSLQLNGNKAVNGALLDILQQEEMKEERLLGINEVSNRLMRDAISPLIQILSSNEGSSSEIEIRTQMALEGMTGQDNMNSASSWRNWWRENKDDFEMPDSPAGGGSITEIARGTNEAGSSRVVGGDDKGIIVVYSEVRWDTVEAMLEANGIPYTAMNKEEFENEGVDPEETYALLVNCGSAYAHGERGTGQAARGTGEVTGYELLDNPFSDRILGEIENFVSQGGYLFTSDRGLMNLIARTDHLSDFLEQTEMSAEEPEKDEHTIWPRPGANAHNLMKDVFIDTTTINPASGNKTAQQRNWMDYTWKIHAESPLFKASRPDVDVLVTAPGVYQKYDGTSGAVAATFMYGGRQANPKVVDGGIIDNVPKAKGGRVLHVLGHIKDQMQAQRDFALQQLLLNFLIEGRLRSMNFQTG